MPYLEGPNTAISNNVRDRTIKDRAIGIFTNGRLTLTGKNACHSYGAVVAVTIRTDLIAKIIVGTFAENNAVSFKYAATV